MAIRSVFGNREHRERKTLANRDYYITLIENKPEAVFLSDFDGDLFLLNKKAQSLTGFTSDDIRDFHLRDLFFTPRNTENPFDSRQFTEFSATLFLLDARRYLIPVNLDFREIEGQKFLCSCNSVEAFPETVQSAGPPAAAPSDTLPQAPKSDAPARWPVDFEHQIRNQLNSILGFGTVMMKEPAIVESKKLTTNLESILKCGNQLKKLFNQNSPGDSDTYEMVRTRLSLTPLLQKTVILSEPLARHHNTSVRISGNTDILVFTDEFLLLELIQFLTGKAIMYSRKHEAVISAAADEVKGRALITIDNVGQDIPNAVINFIRRENQKEVYDLTNPLIIQNQEMFSMLQILNRIEGKISFTTDSSLGEVVQVSLPLAAGKEQTDDLTVLENSIRQKSLKILIVEDEKLTAEILKLYLEGIAEVSQAFSGNEALNIAEIYYGKGIIFNAVIMDIGLPKPWDGVLLKHEMEKKWPEYQHIPFLAQTAFTAKSYTDRIRESRFREHLIKPVNRLDILYFLERHCH